MKRSGSGYRRRGGRYGPLCTELGASSIRSHVLVVGGHLSNLVRSALAIMSFRVHCAGPSGRIRGVQGAEDLGTTILLFRRLLERLQ
jgi:hypothetical protein